MSQDLRNIVAAIERIRDDKKALSADEALEFAKAKSAGFDAKALRRVLQRRAMDDAARDEFDTLVDLYEAALGGKAVARDALKAGASVREAAKKGGISVGAAQAERSKISIPEHDPETGEIVETPKSEAGASTRKGEEEAGAPAMVAGNNVASPASDTQPPAGASPNDATEHGQVAASAPPDSAPAGEPIALDAGPLPDFLDRRKAAVLA